MFCAHCGREIPDNAAFCAFCGKETVKRNYLPESEKESSGVWEDKSDNRSDIKNVDSKTINRKALIAAIIGVAVICVIAAAIAIFMNARGENTGESLNVESSAHNNDMLASEQLDERNDGSDESVAESTGPSVPQNNVIDIHDLEEGWYIADFKTSSTKLQQSEYRHGKGQIYIENGVGRIWLSLADVSVQKLFQGTAEDAKKEGAKLLDLKDQKTGNGIPVRTGSLTVPYLDKEFDCAVLSTDGKWSDHKVMVSNPTTEGVTKQVSKDGTYKINYNCECSSQYGGITDAVIIAKNRNSDVRIEMGSGKYTKAVIGGKTIDSVIENGKSTFTFPAVFDEDISIRVTAVSEGKSYDEDFSIKLIWESLLIDVRGTRFDF